MPARIFRAGRRPIIKLETGNLAVGVYARVCATTADDGNVLPHDLFDGTLNRLLHRWLIRLDLPTGKISAIVSDGDFKSAA